MFVIVAIALTICKIYAKTFFHDQRVKRYEAKVKRERKRERDMNTP